MKPLQMLLAPFPPLCSKMNSAKVQNFLATSPGPNLLKRLMCDDPRDFKPKKALILSKVSRYEYEIYRHQVISDDELERVLTKRGSNFHLLKKHHEIHKSVESNLVEALQRRGIETKVCQRFEYTDNAVQWADIIFSAGGDGTFLMAASKILQNQKPLVGINTDPGRSEGYLCLPKHFSNKVDEAVEKITNGSFYWFLRKRLRITLIGQKDKITEKALELHSQQLKYPEYRYVELLNETTDAADHPLAEPGQSRTGGPEMNLSQRILPILALNEVFLGESLSSRVSYLEVKLDQDDVFKSRNSGLIISTGTGSTSWTFNVNKLTHQSVESLLKIVYETTHFPVNWKDERLVEAVTQKFNHNIVFDPEANMMTYTLRDPHSIGTFPAANEKRPRGHAERMEVKSRCFDACLVIDGSLSFKFNDGMRAVIEILEGDALRTVQLYSA
eukprot:maker-scaffold2069_size21507-snap-gene-0.4 protein:Tk04211 transcript:maker-scaffold2069_size21507-snap-gene-0.4-mRNA-1 annotation:"hypothetical protein DAPPUDRAFT_318645"